MNILLIYFAFPLAVIIISAILEKMLNNPIAVSLLIFAVFLIITFAIFDATFLIATLAYTILALITAVIVSICRNTEHQNSCIFFSKYIKNNDYCINAQEDDNHASNITNQSPNASCNNVESRNMYRKR